MRINLFPFQNFGKKCKKNDTDEDPVHWHFFPCSNCVIKGHGELLALKWWFDEVKNVCACCCLLTHAFWSTWPTLMEISWREKWQYLCPIMVLKVLLVWSGQGTEPCKCNECGHRLHYGNKNVNAETFSEMDLQSDQSTENICLKRL